MTGPEADGDRWTPRDTTLAAETAGRRSRSGACRPRPRPAAARRAAWALARPMPSPFARLVGAERGGRVRGSGALAACRRDPATDVPVRERRGGRRPAAQVLDVPWIADLRDPWALDEMRIYPSRRTGHATCSGCAGSSARADAIIMNTPEAAERARRGVPRAGGQAGRQHPQRLRSRATSPVRRRRPTPRRSGSSTPAPCTRPGRAHAGSRRARGCSAAPPDVDVLTRSHVFLLEALAVLRQRAPSWRPASSSTSPASPTAEDRDSATDPSVRLRGTSRTTRASTSCARPISSSSRCTTCRRAAGRRSCRARPTSTSPRGARSSPRCPTATPATSCRPRPAPRSARRDVSGMADALEQQLERRRHGRVPTSTSLAGGVRASGPELATCRGRSTRAGVTRDGRRPLQARQLSQGATRRGSVAASPICAGAVVAAIAGGAPHRVTAAAA